LFVLRLFVYLGLIAIVVAVVMFLFTRDVRYLRFAWQIFKFSLVFLLVFAILLIMGRLILYRV
jgi:heme/copper-type cytochrome/quinol oxidase subunit 4